MADRSFINDLVREALNLSRGERIDEAYNLSGTLYYAFKRSVGDDLASDLLYTTSAIFLKCSNEHTVSESVYDFLASVFGVRLSYDQVLDSMNRHYTDYKVELFQKALRNFNQDEYTALCLFGCLIYACDGRVTEAERDFLCSL